MPVAVTWMYPENITVSEINQIEKDKYQMISLKCGILKKMIQRNLFTKQK